MESSGPVLAESGSFRDRDGRVYYADNRVIRGISASAVDNFTKLEASGFYRKFLERGRLVNSTLLDHDSVPLPDSVKQEWAGFIEHNRIPVISYPYEWTFSMLQDAALLQLDLVESAVSEGMTLKDSTPYNFQFLRGQPVFIDIPSFETLQAGAPWTGYRQFCEMFLFPLMLQAYKGVNFQPMMRSRIDGIDVQTMSRLFSRGDRFKAGVLAHVWLQAKLDRRFGSTRNNVRSELKSAGFNKEMILANVRKLRKLVSRMTWNGEGSEWGSYDEFHNYSETDHVSKEEFIRKCVTASGAKLVCDLGCNTGQFSKIAAESADTVLAMDLDHFAVERLYREVRESGMTRILPLVQNIADPSPDWGWRNQERRELGKRVRPDVLLCLALVHHLVISANIPMEEFIGWLSGLSDQLIIEYVSRSDEKVETLLRNKEDKYSDYSRQSLEASLDRHYDVIEMQSLESGNRHLYWCRLSTSID